MKYITICAFAFFSLGAFSCEKLPYEEKINFSIFSSYWVKDLDLSLRNNRADFELYDVFFASSKKHLAGLYVGNHPQTRFEKQEFEIKSLKTTSNLDVTRYQKKNGETYQVNYVVKIPDKNIPQFIHIFAKNLTQEEYSILADFVHCIHVRNQRESSD